MHYKLKPKKLLIINNCAIYHTNWQSLQSIIKDELLNYHSVHAV